MTFLHESGEHVGISPSVIWSVVNTETAPWLGMPADCVNTLSIQNDVDRCIRWDWWSHRGSFPIRDNASLHLEATGNQNRWVIPNFLWINRGTTSRWFDQMEWEVGREQEPQPHVFSLSWDAVCAEYSMNVVSAGLEVLLKWIVLWCYPLISPLILSEDYPLYPGYSASSTPLHRYIVDWLLSYLSVIMPVPFSWPGLAFPQLYQKCREAFLVNTDQTLRSHLTEFRDHKLIRIKKVRTVTASHTLVTKPWI